jgi:SAM-dependent methyltransferase
METGNLSSEDAARPDGIVDLLLGALKAATLKAGVELRVWDRVAAGQRTAQAIAHREGWDATGLARLLNALCGLGFLTKGGDGYRLVPPAAAYLVSGEPSYLGDFVLANLPGEGPNPLARAIRTGQRPITDWTQGQQAALWTAWLSPRRAAPHRHLEEYNALWKRVGIAASDGLRVLDVACGSALPGLALARQHSGIRVWLQDWPAVLEGAAAIAEQLGVRGQVEMLPGDARAVDLGRDRFDVAWLGHIAHYFGPGDVVELLRRVQQALVSGGVVVLHEDVADEQRCQREYPLLEALWLYAVSPDGDVYTFPELRAFLEQAGFARVTAAGGLSRVGEELLKATKP